jgi:hypothetical protein
MVDNQNTGASEAGGQRQKPATLRMIEGDYDIPTPVGGDFIADALNALDEGKSLSKGDVARLRGFIKDQQHTLNKFYERSTPAYGAAALYRKKPVVIEAIQWTGNNLRDVISFTGLHQSAAGMKWEDYADLVAREGLKIFTMEGPLNAKTGDFIIKGIAGEFYPCDDRIFEATYEPVV